LPDRETYKSSRSFETFGKKQAQSDFSRRTGKAMENAMSKINEIQPALSVLVVSRWRNASAMRSWFSRYFVEMARGIPPIHEEMANAYGLSARELDILRFMVKGLIKKEIAEQLFISYHTVDNHERNIFRKMNVHTRSAAVARALIERIC
jgi:DNA-binding CsgD family transcriptional regulator